MEARSRASWEAINLSPVRRRILASTYGSALPHALTLSSLPGDQGAPIRKHIPWPAGDCLGLFATLDGRRGYKLSPVGSERISFSRRRRALLVRLCEHVATGYWLRSLSPCTGRAEDNAAAVCTPDGRVLHDTGTAPELSASLVDAVRNMDRARCRRRKRTPEEATELWQALLAGQYTLVESTECGGRRLILAVRCRTPRPALTQREAAIAVAAARGAANKTIAAELGLATGTVGVHLGAALRKLGCPNRRALARWLRAGGPS
jgi:DNA-binding CsgD family transcriptional regulator